jgi:nicotinamide mononucleotide transporter
VDPLEAVAVVFGVVSVYLSVRQHVWSWPTAIVNNALYFIIFRREHLYALMTLQLFYAAVASYGWYHWLFGGGEGRDTLPVTRTPRPLRTALPLLGVAATGLIGAILTRTPDAEIPYLDAGLTVASLIAMWMMSRKYLENWRLWIGVNVASIITFGVRGLWLTMVLYLAFLVLASMGHVEWTRSWRARQAGAGEPAEA